MNGHTFWESIRLRQYLIVKLVKGIPQSFVKLQLRHIFSFHKVNIQNGRVIERKLPKSKQFNNSRS